MLFYIKTYRPFYSNKYHHQIQQQNNDDDIIINKYHIHLCHISLIEILNKDSRKRRRQSFTQ